VPAPPRLSAVRSARNPRDPCTDLKARGRSLDLQAAPRPRCDGLVGPIPPLARLGPVQPASVLPPSPVRRLAAVEVARRRLPPVRSGYLSLPPCSALTSARNELSTAAAAAGADA
jgi:hypothetical protein